MSAVELWLGWLFGWHKHWNEINLLFSRNGNVAELKRLMEWKHIAREAITAGSVIS